MSEAPDQPVAAETPASGVEAEAPAATTPATDDLDTESFDRMEAPPEDTNKTPESQAEGGEETDKPTPAQDPEAIEVEAGGAKFKVPAALKPFLLMQEDYTKKTQEVAEQRRAVETDREALAAEKAQQAQSLQTFRAEHAAIAAHEASIATIDADLAKYRQLTAQDWAAMRSNNPTEYDQHSQNYDFLKRTREASNDALAAAKEGLTAKEAKLAEDQKAARSAALSKAWGEATADLAKNIKDWSPAKGQEIGNFMVRELGATAEELKEATDPRIWKMAHRIMTAEAENTRLTAALKQATATTTALKTQETTPAAKTPGAAQPRGVVDNLATKEWMDRRNAQAAKRRA